MRIFTSSNYKKIIKELVSERKLIDKDFTFQKLAKEAEIPKSYFSKILNEDAHLSQDQLFSILELFQLSDLEKEYMTLLLEYARSQNRKRKSLLKQKVNAFQADALDAKKNLEAESIAVNMAEVNSYYGDPLNLIIHMALMIPKYAQDPRLLSPLLDVGYEHLWNCIETLERLGIVASSKKGYSVIKDSLHLPRDSQFFRLWLSSVRSFSLSKINKVGLDERYYSFSVFFTIDESGRKNIRNRFLEFLKDCESIVKSSKDSQVMQMNFDLLPWLTEP